MRRPGRAVAAVAVVVATFAFAGGSRAAATPAVGSQLPNLVPLPAFDLGLGRADPDTGRSAIRFSVAVVNRSDYAFDLLAVPNGSVNGAAAEQCVAWAAPRACIGRASAGRFEWHPEHAHYHFQAFGSYELRALRYGRPDMSDKGLVVGGEKVSYCLIDVERHEDRGAAYQLPWPFYMSCLVGAGYQGISPGWADVYGSSLDGQQIVVDGVRDGKYALVIRTDPTNRIAETDDTDNVAASQIELSGAGAHVLCDYDARLKKCSPRPVS